MGDMLRCDPMTYCDVYLQPEAAFEILSQLGDMGCVQFTDMNPNVTAFQKRYISEVCRCAEMERKLRFIESEMIKDNIYRPEPLLDAKTMDSHEMVVFENMIEKWDDDITEMAKNLADLRKAHKELMEMYYVLNHIGPLLGDAELLEEPIFNAKGPQGDIAPGSRLFVMTGVVKRKKCFHFETMLWRISRGNIYYRQASVDKTFIDPYSGREIRKVAFLAVCQGEQLAWRMEKVFSGFRVENYPCPQTMDERSEKITNIYNSLADLEKVLSRTTYHRCKALRAVGREWKSWMMQVRKTKAVYHTMNLFTLDITKNCLIGQCWVPDKDLKRVQETLKTCSNLIGTNVPCFMLKTGTHEVPPTFHRTNKFTHGFQALINAYGDSKYRELNPGLYTIITFPFLFAIMFGDIGHAIILIVFSTWMLINEKKFMAQKSKNEIWIILFGGRYIILLLGLFSLYTGFIYNDVFSLHMAFTNSYFKITLSKKQLMDAAIVTLTPDLDVNAPYLFGKDPIWGFTAENVLIENMMKMKLSIIVGVIHLIFGTSLSLFNYIHAKTYYLILLQFLPEMLLLCSLFLWLVIMIYMKWFHYGGHFPDVKHQPGCAPQILILFMDMMLFKETTLEENSLCDAYMFEGQRTLQMTLVGVGMMCIPVMLFGPPIYVIMQKQKTREKSNKKVHSIRPPNQDTQNRDVEEVLEEQKEEDEASISELMIYQAVQTMEFTLSTISHTASYLRLWALSLAHAQLSAMLWQMLLGDMALHDHTPLGIVKIFVVFSIWGIFTISILVVMEGLSAFLHTLRLHWVEFMSKFYHGGGYPFRPFCFRDILNIESENPEPACKKSMYEHNQV